MTTNKDINQDRKVDGSATKHLSLVDLYYDDTGAYKTEAALFKKQKELNLGHKRYEIGQFIRDQLVNEIFSAGPTGNSFVPHAVNHQWHMDIAELPTGPKYLVAVDTFSKRQSWQPISTKNQDDVETAFLKITADWGVPESIFVDQEKAFNVLEKYTQRIINFNGHAPMAERAIQTIKRRLALVRADGPGGKNSDLIQKIVKAYNGQNIYKPTGLTPDQMALEINKFRVEMVYGKAAENNKTQPALEINDEVRVAVKIADNEKKHQPRWSQDIYSIKRIKESPGLPTSYEIMVENAAGRRTLQEFIRSDIRPALATGTSEDKVEEEEAEPPQDRPIPAVIRNDEDSAFQPAIITEKRQKKANPKFQ